MLTIKHVDQHGHHHLVQADWFNTDTVDGGYTRYYAQNAGSIPGDTVADWFGDDTYRHNYGPLGAQPITGEPVEHQAIYVMNKDGATVGTYRFITADFERGLYIKRERKAETA